MAAGGRGRHPSIGAGHFLLRMALKFRLQHEGPIEIPRFHNFLKITFKACPCSPNLLTFLHKFYPFFSFFIDLNNLQSLLKFHASLFSSKLFHFSHFGILFQSKILYFYTKNYFPSFDSGKNKPILWTYFCSFSFNIQSNSRAPF